MARLKQQHPQNYISSGNINTEFESIIRYVNAAELGNFTIGELLDKIYDENGEFDGPIEFRADTTVGIQYRVGEFDASEADEDWVTLIDYADLRGPAGTSVGSVEGAIFFNRQEFTATSAQTVFSYTFDTTDDVMVWTNGVLNIEADYTKDAAANTVTFAVGRATSDKITILTVRASSVTNYRRSDIVASASQAVFPFVHTNDETLLVYKNGIILVEGGGNDYTSSASSDTITLVSAASVSDKITILTIENLAAQNITGLMFESEYTDSSGSIMYSTLFIEDGDIPQAKVNGLVAALSDNATLTVSASTPVSPSTGDLWQDTSVSPNKLKFYDGAAWISTSPSSELPAFTSSNAGEYVRVNGTGTSYELGTIDFSTLVPKTYMGAANGVASLDSTGKMPITQLPEIFSVDTINFTEATVANGTGKFIKWIYKQKVRFDGITHKLSAGTCTIQLAVDGTTVGSTHASTTSQTNSAISPTIEVDGTSTAKRIELDVTSASGTGDLEVGFSVATLST